MTLQKLQGKPFDKQFAYFVSPQHVWKAKYQTMFDSCKI